MNQSNHTPRSVYDNLALASLITGILGLIACCYPPTQLLLGAAAILTAYLSRNETRLPGPSIAGLILGILSVIVSILMFLQYLWILALLQNPGQSPLLQEFLRRYMQLQ